MKPENSPSSEMPNLVDTRYSRREMLAYSLSGAVAFSMRNVLGAEEKTQLTHRAELIKSVEAKGWDVPQTLPTAEQEGKGALQKNYIKPTGRKLTPYILHGRLNVLTPGFTSNGNIRLPCPANIGEQRHLASRVEILVDDKPVPVTNYNSKILYSQELEQHQDQRNMLRYNSYRGATESACIKIYTWLLEPEYPEWSQAELEEYITGLRGYPQISKALRHAGQIKEGSDENRKYQTILNTRDDFGVIQGECGPRAYVFSEECGMDSLYIEGLPTDDQRITTTDGLHTYAMLQTPNGMIMVDPKNEQDYQLLPQTNFVTTKISTRNRFKEYPLEDERATNRGFWGGNGKNEDYQWGGARISSVSAGEFSDEVAAMEPPEEIIKLADAMSEQMKKAY